MYRKKTILLCSVHNPTLKPVGIAVLVSDERKTALRVSVKGINAQKCYLVVSFDGIEDCFAFDSTKGGEMFLSASLLEKVTCFLLDVNLSPLCFGSSMGRVMTAQGVKWAQNKVQEKFFAKKTKNHTQQRERVVDEQTQKEIETQEEKEIKKGKENKKQREQKEENQEKNIKTSFDGDYEQFVLATDNYYADSKIDVGELLGKQAKVSLAEYAKALEEFYQNGAKGRYLAKVGAELEKVFESYSPYLPLMQKIAGSFFVKITDGKGNFFALGLLQEDGKPTHICYALPKTTDEKTDFLTVCVTEGDNKIDFCLIMQSAEDGKVFKPKA